MAKRDLIKQLTKSDLCVGCGLCQSIISDDKIRIDMTSEGYLRPHLKEKMTDNEECLIKKVCPGIYLEHENIDQNSSPIWGPLIRVRTGYAVDSQVRYFGSSGGVISAILIYLLLSKKVDYVLHVAASKVDPLLNEVIISKSREDVLLAAGSRYLPSAPLTNIVDHLRMGSKFAFVGKPCDVAALRNYARLDDRVNRTVAYMISFMCAGVPSVNGTLEILGHYGIKKKGLTCHH